MDSLSMFRISQRAYAHYVPYFGEGGGGTRTGAFGALSRYSAQICIVGKNIAYAFAYWSSDCKYILGKLFFEVSVSYRTVGVSLSEVSYDIGCRCQFKQGEKISYGFTHGRIRFFWAFVGCCPHYFFAQHFWIVGKIYAVALAFAHLS